MRSIMMLPVFTALCATAVTASPASAAGTTALPIYRVIQLSTGNTISGADINAKGQVAFTEYNGANTRAKFYDGRSVRDLGTLGGPVARTAAVNDLGQVTGSAAVSRDGSVTHAYRWTPLTGMVDLTGTMRTTSYGADINNRGQVTGTVAGSGQGILPYGFFWSSQTGLLNIGKLDEYSWPTAMNDYGAIVGYGGADGPYGALAFRWTRAEGIRGLGTLPQDLTQAADINNLGHIVGATPFSITPPQSDYVHAFYWTALQGLRDLGTGTGNESAATRINDKDMVIGAVQNFGILYHGFIWTRDTGMLEIGARRPDLGTFAGGLNNQGQVVGAYGPRAFVWTRGTGMVDLNTRLAGAPSGLVLTAGEAISDNGSIVARSNTGLVLLVPGSATQQAPVIGQPAVSGPTRPNALLSFSASFTDVDPADTHQASWSWGDGSVDTGILSAKNGAGSVSGQHSFRAPGIYAVKLTVRDSSGRSSTVQRRVIVSGPGMHVRGDGSFVSPQGASRFAPRQAGVASLAILAPAGTAGGAQNGARVEFSAPGLAMHGEPADAQPGPNGHLQVRGTASVNGASGYRFLLTKSGDGKERVRIRIWHQEAGSQVEVVDYDNLPGARASAAASEGSALTEGSVGIGAD